MKLITYTWTYTNSVFYCQIPYFMYSPHKWNTQFTRYFPRFATPSFRGDMPRNYFVNIFMLLTWSQINVQTFLATDLIGRREYLCWVSNYSRSMIRFTKKCVGIMIFFVFRRGKCHQVRTTGPRWLWGERGTAGQNALLTKSAVLSAALGVVLRTC